MDKYTGIKRHKFKFAYDATLKNRARMIIRISFLRNKQKKIIFQIYIFRNISEAFRVTFLNENKVRPTNKVKP